MDFFTLAALAREWDAALAGATLTDAWTQAEGELSVALELPDGGEPWTLRVRCDPALPLLFRAAGAGRQKRNTHAVFEGLVGRTVRGVTTARLDRQLFLQLSGGSALAVLLFGPRPNVLWSHPGPAGWTVREAFLRPSEGVGEPAPAPRPAADPRTAAEIRARWPARARTLGQALRQAAPLLPAALAADAARAAGLDPAAPADALHDDALDRLCESAAETRARLDAPAPHVLWRGTLADALVPAAPVALPEGARAESFASVDEAARVYARRALAQRRFAGLFRPAEAALAGAAARRARSAEAMLDELAQPSRADRYEHWAHLLMALETAQGPGRERTIVPDLLGDGAPVEIPLDPARSAVANAERLYDRARRARGARAAAEARWAGVHGEAEAAADLLARLRAVDALADLQAFLAAHAGRIAALAGPDASGSASEPFRRFALPGGHEALVGKHARGNAELTTRLARPHDLWLHARGVPGSHVVVRRASRTAIVPEAAVEAAARLAAHFSDARTQALAPVTVAERKHVRPVKGGPPGAVRVDRERVLLVVPGLPGPGGS